ncbi:hypothetical protein EV421DRAFT_495983 [Armillaria borealis]|uniref:Uncharacterized protein n=1 Tax=Armillaria borealis TaxID=47425 RepID=A0AA39JJZ6_9AGAR|nr:hypothetical protein EV421DRAFT_495983 [Armillaria borealis]
MAQDSERMARQRLETRCSRPYDLWKREPLQKFFQDHGYTLWISEYEQGLGDIYNVQLHPPNDEPRRPDGYTFVSRYQCQPGILIHKPEFSQVNSIHCPARTIHNQDVLIRLISIDGDARDDHYEAIRRLSQGQTAFRTVHKQNQWGECIIPKGNFSDGALVAHNDCPNTDFEPGIKASAVATC